MSSIDTMHATRPRPAARHLDLLSLRTSTTALHGWDLGEHQKISEVSAINKGSPIPHHRRTQGWSKRVAVYELGPAKVTANRRGAAAAVETREWDRSRRDRPGHKLA